MSISSSIYIGTSGVLAQQQNMSVIADNIANMNTVGFKSARTLFDTLISEQLTGATVGNQIGQGVNVSSIYADMTTVGPLETTNTSTDMAISGSYGMFMVRPENSTQTYYTRAGSYRFDENGYLCDSSGNILQGYTLPDATDAANVTVAAASTLAMGDIRLSTDNSGMAISQPEATTSMGLVVNLDSSDTDHISNSSSPATAMFDSWDATKDTPLSDTAYAYATALTVYDSTGQSHTVTAYFDPVTTLDDTADGYSVWEYMLTVPPDEDVSALSTKQGILMTGTMTFASTGTLSTMSAYTGTEDDKSTWTPATLSADGLPTFSATFSSGGTITSTWDMGVSTNDDWNIPAGVSSLADVGTSYANLANMTTPLHSALATTSYDAESSTLDQNQNGYGEGTLESISVNSAGLIIGEYSNGQSQALFKVPLADFINPQGLFREGGNLYSATTQSGTATVGWAGESRLGLLAGSTIENSNVDLATEFVNMITSQKGFDADSKVITTADQVVQTAIQMKK